ncbi:MAG: hypothetical protein JWR17_2899 [Pseudomonas sp.]|uniref:DUF1652 domain-containing protein n=1 Tax=Pseudomonas sp. TaxID=306 RepID=UPI00260C48C4|nr:DUF1652 domain-containing protein [Pseudomonas sp.]MDB6050153.1 hypothetical protein [Pseudomonas sp.]
MFSLSYIRRTLEKSFAPLACECTVGADARLTVRIFDRDTGRVDLVVTGITIEKLRSAEAVAKMVDELRYEIDGNTLRAAQVAE